MRNLLRGALVIIIAIALGMLARQYVIGFTRVIGESMDDTLMWNDYAFITKYDYGFRAPRRGEIAMINVKIAGSSVPYIKRVIGLPGEDITIIAGQVFIDGALLDEPYATPDSDDYHITLGEGEYFVMGDNRAVSYDSREPDIGAIPRSAFDGRARAIVWPFSRMKFGIE